LAITRTSFDLVVVGLTPDNAANRAAIEEAVDDLFASKEPYIEGLSTVRRDTIGYAETTATVQEVVAALGAVISGILVKEGAASFDLRVLGQGEKAKFGSASYIV
jgi:hypothetical protein